MNARRMAELDAHPERATAGELVTAVLASLVLAAMVIGLVGCGLVRVMQEVGR